MSGVRSGTADTVDWFGGGFPPGYDPGMAYGQPQGPGGPALAVRERPVETSAITSSFQVTTADVMDVLGPDADDLLATANLDVDGLISMINAETMLLPRIDEELEAMFAAESAAEPDYFHQKQAEEPQADSIGKR